MTRRQFMRKSIVTTAAGIATFRQAESGGECQFRGPPRRRCLKTSWSFPCRRTTLTAVTAAASSSLRMARCSSPPGTLAMRSNSRGSSAAFPVMAGGLGGPIKTVLDAAQFCRGWGRWLPSLLRLKDGRLLFGYNTRQQLRGLGPSSLRRTLLCPLLVGRSEDVERSFLRHPLSRLPYR